MIFTLHDLRRTYATHADKLVSSYTLKQLLNHKISSTQDVTAGYVIQSSEQLKKPAEKITRKLLQIAGREQSSKLPVEKVLTELGDLERKQLLRALLAEYNTI